MQLYAFLFLLGKYRLPNSHVIAHNESPEDWRVLLKKHIDLCRSRMDTRIKNLLAVFECTIPESKARSPCIEIYFPMINFKDSQKSLPKLRIFTEHTFCKRIEPDLISTQSVTAACCVGLWPRPLPILLQGAPG